MRPGGLLYYSLCNNISTFRGWSSLFHEHTPVFLPASSFIPTSPFINFGDFCQPLVYCNLPFYCFCWSLQASTCTPFSPSIWNSRVYVKDPFQSKYQLPINGREKVWIEILKIPKAFIDYSQAIDDVYEN